MPGRKKARRQGPIWKAVEEGDLKTTRKVVAKEDNDSLNERNARGDTLLGIAADGNHRNHLEIARVLLEAGAKVNRPARDRETPVFLACWKGHVKMVRLLLEYGASLTAGTSREQDRICALLRGSCHRSSTELPSLLLRHTGVNVDSADANEGNTALHNACKASNMDLVRLLLKYGADPNVRNKKGRTPLHECTLDEAVVLLMKKPNIDVNAKDSRGQTLLHLTCLNWNPWGSQDIICVLAERGADMNTVDGKGYTALHRSARLWLLPAIKALIDTGRIDINLQDKDGCTALHHAVDKSRLSNSDDHSDENRCKCAEILLENGAAPNIQNKLQNTPFHLAVASEVMCQTLSVFLQNGADTNARDVQGNTPLHLVTNLDAARLLLSNGSDPNSENNKGRTALVEACINRSKRELCDWIPAFLEYEGFEPNVRFPGGETLLHLLATEDFEKASETLGLLLDRGADSCLRDNNGDTPLHIICRRSNAAMMTLITQKGAGSAGVPDRHGRFPFQLACLHDWPLNEIHTLLRLDPSCCCASSDEVML